MTNELISKENLSISKYSSDAIFDELAKASEYLPYIQLFASNSKPVLEEKIGGGHFGLPSGESITSLGKEFNCLPLSWRPKAMDFNGDIIAIYNMENPEFSRIREMAEADGQSGCVFGIEFLLWVPGHGFVTYYFASKSSKRETPALRGLIGQAATIRSKLVSNTKGSWFVPVVTGCSEPFEQPSEDKLQVQLEKFNNPVDSDVEAVKEEEVRAR